MDVPSFLQLERDLENGRVILSVDDANVAQQKEMWGEFPPLHYIQSLQK